MVSVSLSVLKTITKPMQGPWDFGFTFQHDGNIGKLIVYDEDCVWCLFLKFLVCPEIATVFITDVYGSVFDGTVPWEHSPYGTLTDVSQIEERFWMYIMPALFPEHRVVPFNQSELTTHKERIMKDVRDRATVLAALFPYNVIAMVLRPEIPTWVRYDHTPYTSFPVVDDHEAFLEQHFQHLFSVY